MYRISEEQIGSTNPSGIFPEFRDEYSLAPSDDKSSTMVRYISERCFPLIKERESLTKSYVKLRLNKMCSSDG